MPIERIFFFFIVEIICSAIVRTCLSDAPEQRIKYSAMLDIWLISSILRFSAFFSKAHSATSLANFFVSIFSHLLIKFILDYIFFYLVRNEKFDGFTPPDLLADISGGYVEPMDLQQVYPGPPVG